MVVGDVIKAIGVVLLLVVMIFLLWKVFPNALSAILEFLGLKEFAKALGLPTEVELTEFERAIRCSYERCKTGCEPEVVDLCKGFKTPQGIDVCDIGDNPGQIPGDIHVCDARSRMFSVTINITNITDSSEKKILHDHIKTFARWAEPDSTLAGSCTQTNKQLEGGELGHFILTTHTSINSSVCSLGKVSIPYAGSSPAIISASANNRVIYIYTQTALTQFNTRLNDTPFFDVTLKPGETKQFSIPGAPWESEKVIAVIDASGRVISTALLIRISGSTVATPDFEFYCDSSKFSFSINENDIGHTESHCGYTLNYTSQVWVFNVTYT